MSFLPGTTQILKKREEKINPLKYFRIQVEIYSKIYLQERHSVFSTEVDEFYIFHSVVKENT